MQLHPLTFTINACKTAIASILPAHMWEPTGELRAANQDRVQLEEEAATQAAAAATLQQQLTTAQEAAAVQEAAAQEAAAGAQGAEARAAAAEALVGELEAKRDQLAAGLEQARQVGAGFMYLLQEVDSN